MYDKSISHFLHNYGFAFEKRRFKSFTFSNINGLYKIVGKEIIFKSPIDFYLSSSWDELIKTIVEYFMNMNNININGKKCIADSIKIIPNPDFEKANIVKTQSPITVYSTNILDERKETQFYDATDIMFAKLIKENLQKKAKSIYQLDLDDDFKILNVDKRGIMRHIKYKDFLIKAWSGSFEIETTPIMKKIAYELGLGSKNSMGFGAINLLEN